jgi:hypothetical protein
MPVSTTSTVVEAVAISAIASGAEAIIATPSSILAAFIFL